MKDEWKGQEFIQPYKSLTSKALEDFLDQWPEYGTFPGMMKFYNRIINAGKDVIEFSLDLNKKGLDRFLTAMDEFEDKPKGYHHMIMNTKESHIFVLKNFPDKKILVAKYKEPNYKWHIKELTSIELN